MSGYGHDGSAVPTKILPQLGDRVKYHGTATEYTVTRLNEDGSVALLALDEPITFHRSTPRLLTLVERAA